MPFNSFDDYPMAWKPNRSELEPPLYLSLANLLERAIKSGDLLSNTKLPPQRELADYLDINHSTVTRAYKLCEMRGLVHGIVGSGTFVSPEVGTTVSPADMEDHEVISMGRILPFYEHNALIRDAALSLLKKPLSETLFEYESPFGTYGQKLAGVKWLQTLGIEADPALLLITPGTQNALAITLMSLMSPGDRIAVDPYTYPHLKGLAEMLHVQLVAIASDEKGMLAEDLRERCSAEGLEGVFVMPSCNNPLAKVMPSSRREELALVAQEHDLLVIEDDTYAFLHEEPLGALKLLLPDQTVYLSGLSKPISAGIRVAYLLAPAPHYQRLESGYINLNIKTSSLNMEIASEVIHKGTADVLVCRKRQLARERNAAYYRHFPSSIQVMNTMYQWLELPRGLSGKTLEERMLAEGIKVQGSERFSVGNESCDKYVRIATCSPKTTEELCRGLDKIRQEIEKASV